MDVSNLLRALSAAIAFTSVMATTTAVTAQVYKTKKQTVGCPDYTTFENVAALVDLGNAAAADRFAFNAGCWFVSGRMKVVEPGTFFTQVVTSDGQEFYVTAKMLKEARQ